MSSESIIPVQQDKGGRSEINPHGLIEAISFIEQQYSNECGGAETRGGLFTTQQRIEFMEVGFKGALQSGLVLALLTPVAVGVFEKLIPIFGDAQPTLFDKFFAFMLSVGFSLSYSGFIAQICMKWRGGYTRQMVICLMSGFAGGGVLKAVTAFILFHFIYMKALTDEPLLAAAAKIQGWGVGQDRVLDALQWVMGARHIMIESAWIVLISTALTILIPVVAYMIAAKRNRRLVSLGICAAPVD